MLTGIARDILTASMQAVTRGGRIVIVGNTGGPQAEIDIRYIFGKRINLIESTMGSHQDFLDVTELIASGRLEPAIDRVMPLRDGKTAWEPLEYGAFVGKIALAPDGP
jgi:alcohol dehydrogenase